MLQEGNKKESVREDESRSAVTMLLFNMAELGGGTGIAAQRLAPSVQLCDTGRPGRDTGALRTDRRLFPSATHIVLPWHRLTSKTRLYSQELLSCVQVAYGYIPGHG